jgi:hypothetical protein
MVHQVKGRLVNHGISRTTDEKGKDEEHPADPAADPGLS